MRNVAYAKDITTLSIPFVCGVSIGSFIPCGAEACYFPASVAFLSASMLLVLSASMRKTGLAMHAAMLFIGLSTSFGARIPGMTSSVSVPLAERALESFSKAIDDAGFSHDSTSALVKALLTGRKESLDRDIVQAFREGGGAHILALSGLHLGIIYGILSKSLSVLGNSRAAGIARSVATVTACGFYALMTGLSPSIERAFLFITLNELSRHMPGRRRRPIATLCAALTIQLAVKPDVIGSTGFQLSYLAMAGICCIKPWLDRLYPESEKEGPVKRIWNSAATAISCQATTAPLAWAKFHTFPKFFLICNLVALPLTEALVVCSLLTVGLDAAGACPEMMKGLTDQLAQALIFCLRTVSEM